MSSGDQSHISWWQDGIRVPQDGSFVSRREDGGLSVPTYPIIPFLRGDGIGPEITPAMIAVVNQAVEASYGGERSLRWVQVLAGDEAEEHTGTRLPDETLQFLKKAVVAIKGPLGTPVGGGGKSLNATLRQTLDYYSALRPVFWMGQPTPLPHPERVNVAVFRENSDDVYMGIEFFAGQSDTQRVRRFLLDDMDVADAALPDDCGITVKPMSEFKTKRHVRKALRYAFAHDRRSVALAGKGNIMKATEGAFLKWGFEVAEEAEFKDRVIREGQPTAGQILLQRVITDQMLMQLVLRPDAYDVVITQNLNGDYISDLAAALVGGPGFVPSCNMGDGYALFESTHGTAPDIAGRGVANPVSLTLSGGMLLQYLGWEEASARVSQAVKQTIEARQGTPDIVHGFKRQGQEAQLLSTEAFAQAMCDNISEG